MVRKSFSGLKLSFDQANAICRGLLPIGDHVFDYMGALEQGGFSAFVPHYKLIKSYCASDDEKAIHKQCIIEAAKNLLGRPWPFRVTETQDRMLYFSPFIQQLNWERDQENGIPVSGLPTKYPGEIWRIEIDPCWRRKAYDSIRAKHAHEARSNAAQQEGRRRLALEVERNATGLAGGYAFDKQGRYAFYTASMTRNAAELGFDFDAAKSKPNYPVFSKRISQEWDLSWTLEEPKMFYLNAVEGRFQPYLGIRHRDLIGSIETRKLGEYLFIRYHESIPGFTVAYGKFLDLDCLETLIKAHLCLYRLMAPTIEGAVRAVLAGARAG